MGHRDGTTKHLHLQEWFSGLGGLSWQLADWTKLQAAACRRHLLPAPPACLDFKRQGTGCGSEDAAYACGIKDRLWSRGLGLPALVVAKSRQRAPCRIHSGRSWPQSDLTGFAPWKPRRGWGRKAVWATCPQVQAPIVRAGAQNSEFDFVVNVATAA
ncbi:unnamed protein product [Symbiodinium sp. CCMP2592]|nr:unnamed protein product [Symbiodinium sp. CCMP2592]